MTSISQTNSIVLFKKATVVCEFLHVKLKLQATPVFFLKNNHLITFSKNNCSTRTCLDGLREDVNYLSFVRFGLLQTQFFKYPVEGSVLSANEGCGSEERCQINPASERRFRLSTVTFAFFPTNMPSDHKTLENWSPKP